MLKEELRREMRLRKQQYTLPQLVALSQPIVARLRSLLAGARVVLAYYSLPDEVFTHTLLDELVADGKIVLLPKVIDDERMELRRYSGPRDLVEGTFGIMEPSGPPFPLSAHSPSIDVALIPGVAFDAQGRRLGRGRGYYDRFLRSLGVRPNLFGVCFDFQKVPAVPVDANDISVDVII